MPTQAVGACHQRSILLIVSILSPAWPSGWQPDASPV